MLQINVENNNYDNYVLLYCDGVDNNDVKLSEDDLRGKQIVVSLNPVYSGIFNFGRHMIEQINKLTEMNGANDIIILPNNDKFNFHKELNVEELLYENYDSIKHPEMISVRTLDYFATNERGEMIPIHTVHPLPHCKDIDKKIELFAADINNSDLSSFEKILATHIMCTRFMNTDVEHENNGTFFVEPDLKNVYGSSMHILSDGDDGYKIKCGGYVDLFSRILKKMKLSSKPMVISNVDNDYGHVVSLIDIYDTKYGINGTYVSDLRSDSDSREYMEAKDGGIMEDAKNYWGFNSLGYFCMNRDDFISLLGLDLLDSPTIYSVDSTSSYNGGERFVSNGRIPIDSIKKALTVVYRHMYSINDNLDVYLNRGASDGMTANINREIEFVKKMRDLADSNTSSSNKSGDDLNSMFDKQNGTSNGSTNNNGENEHKK